MKREEFPMLEFTVLLFWDKIMVGNVPEFEMIKNVVEV